MPQSRKASNSSSTNSGNPAPVKLDLGQEVLEVFLNQLIEDGVFGTHALVSGYPAVGVFVIAMLFGMKLFQWLDTRGGQPKRETGPAAVGRACSYLSDDGAL